MYTIPTGNNIINLIENIHISIIHQGKNKFLDKINALKIFYHGLYKDMDLIMNLCDVCIQKNFKFYKRFPSKQLVFSRSRDRFIIDITYIPIDPLNNKNNIFLLNILEHFSKFLVSYLIPNKKRKTICAKLEDCFYKFGTPIEIGADKGSEFSNKYVIYFLILFKKLIFLYKNICI